MSEELELTTIHVQGAIQGMGVNSQGVSIPLRLPSGPGAARVDGAYQLIGLDSSNLPILMKLNDDGTIPVSSGNIPNLDASKIVSGVFPPARLGTGSLGTGVKFLRDDGTFSAGLAGPVLQLDGTTGAPSYSFSGDAGTGFYRDQAAALIGFVYGSTRIAAFNINGVIVRDSKSILWGSSVFDTPDVGISRELANQLEVHTGTPGTFGYMKAAAFITTDNVHALTKRGGAWTDQSGSQVATLTNSPVAGTPTKWVAVDDQGVTRYMPLW